MGSSGETPFSVDVCANDGSVRFVVEGELDLATAPVLASHLDHACELGERDVVLDVGELQCIDSSGLNLLVGAHARLQKVGRRLQLANVNAPVDRVLQISGLDQVFVNRDGESSRPPSR